MGCLGLVGTQWGWAGPGALQAQLAGSGLSGCPGCWHPLYSSSCRPSTSLPELWATVWCVSSRQLSPEPPPSARCQLAALSGLLSSRCHGATVGLECGHTYPEHLAVAWPPPAPLLAWPPRMRGGVA